MFGPDSKQAKVYSQAIVPIVEEVLDGYNCTIFAYGQTGTGKTYTMEGGPRNSDDGKDMSAEAGVIPRALKQIFDAIECDQVSDSSVKVSFLELYNEEVTDLLCMSDDKEKRLRLMEDKSGVVVQGLEEVVVNSVTGMVYHNACCYAIALCHLLYFLYSCSVFCSSSSCSFLASIGALSKSSTMVDIVQLLFANNLLPTKPYNAAYRPAEDLNMPCVPSCCRNLPGARPWDCQASHC